MVGARPLVLVVLSLLTFLLAILLAGLPRPAQAQLADQSVTLRLDSSQIVLGDTLFLDIETVGLPEPADTAPLEAVAKLGRETRGTRIAVVGGKVVEIRLRRVEIQPLNAGTVIIGPLFAGEVASNSVVVNVLAEAPPAWAPGPDDLKLEMTVSRRDPRVQEEVVLDVVFSHRHPILADRLPVPVLDGFRAVPVWTERRTVDEAAGWRQIAWRWLIFPERSGAMTIPELKLSGEMISSRVERGLFSVTAPSISFNVLPSVFPEGKWWLPARDLTLAEDWSQDVRELNAGDEVTRVLTLSARGVTASQLPDVLMPESRALGITRIASERSQEVTPEGMTARASFTYRVRALSPVPVFPDTIRLSWWDTQSRQTRESIIPARRINIGAPDRNALLRQADERRGLAGRLAAWLRVTTAPGLLAASGLALLAAALLAGAPALLAPAWARHRHRRAMLHALRQARDLAQSGDAMALYTHLERHAAQDACAALRPARAALGTMLFSPGGQTSLKDIERLLPERT